MRRSFQKLDLLHKCYATPNTIDNDFYLRLGTFNRLLTPVEIEEISTNIRNLLAKQSPLYISIDRSNLAFARYGDLFFSLKHTKILSLSISNADNLRQMYDGTKLNTFNNDSFAIKNLHFNKRTGSHISSW